MKKTLVTTAAVLALAGAAAAPASASESFRVDSTTSAPGAVSTQQVTTQSTVESSPFSQAVAEEMLRMINDARAQQGLQPLNSNGALTGMATTWSQQMAAGDSATHNPTFIEQTQATGSSVMAENIAYDVTSGQSVEQTAQYFFDFWMNSPGHHANIMNPEFNALGFGLAESSSGYVYATQNFGAY